MSVIPTNIKRIFHSTKGNNKFFLVEKFFLVGGGGDLRMPKISEGGFLVGCPPVSLCRGSLRFGCGASGSGPVSGLLLFGLCVYGLRVSGPLVLAQGLL